MADEQPFIAAILASPDDDGPRMIYADWLDEHGQSERAEFIRVQCELAAPVECEWMTRGLDCERYNADVPPYRVVVKCPACRRVKALGQRERELLERHGLAWLPTPVKEVVVVGPDRAASEGFLCGTFRRGFVESVTGRAEDCLAHLDAILRCQPVREVTLTTWPTLTQHADFLWWSGRWPRIGNWRLPQQTRGTRAAVMAASQWMREHPEFEV